jgi:hypothetical protein
VQTLPYVDGTAVSTSFANGNFYIGHDLAWYPKGLIDQVSIWNKALTSNDVLSLYNFGNGLISALW